MQPHSVESAVTLSGLRPRVTNIGLVIASSVQLVREGLAETLRRLEGVAVRDTVDFSPVSMERIADWVVARNVLPAIAGMKPADAYAPWSRVIPGVVEPNR